MLQVGTYQNLTVVSRKEHGIYLADKAEGAEAANRVLLPMKEVPEDTQIGEPLRVFIYRDSMDRLIATTARPLIALHEVRLLRVKELTQIGAFLDWGLPKDLLLPYAEIPGEKGKRTRLHPGDEILAALYVDKSGRLAATMKIYPYLRKDAPYIKDMHVTARIYQMEESFGAFAAVDDLYSGMIPRRELTGRERVGDVLTLRVTKVHEDGKLDLSPREAAYAMMEEDAEAVLRVIEEEYGGALPFDDKASPDRIREVFGLSKAAFKRAVGRLYKERKIALADGRITTV